MRLFYSDGLTFQRSIYRQCLIIQGQTLLKSPPTILFHLVDVRFGSIEVVHIWDLKSISSIVSSPDPTSHKEKGLVTYIIDGFLVQLTTHEGISTRQSDYRSTLSPWQQTICSRAQCNSITAHYIIMLEDYATTDGVHNQENAQKSSDPFPRERWSLGTRLYPQL